MPQYPLPYTAGNRIPKQRWAFTDITAYIYGLKITRIRKTILKQVKKYGFTKEENIIHMYISMKNIKLLTLILMC